MNTTQHTTKQALITIALTLVCIVPATAATYYVDASSGYDGNDGLAPESAWQSLNRITWIALEAGDTVLLKRGDVWHEPLIMHLSLIHISEPTRPY